MEKLAEKTGKTNFYKLAHTGAWSGQCRSHTAPANLSTTFIRLMPSGLAIWVATATGRAPGAVNSCSRNVPGSPGVVNIRRGAGKNAVTSRKRRGSRPAACGGVAFGDVSGDRVDAGAGVPLQGADEGVAGAGQQHRGRGAVLGVVRQGTVT